MKVTKQVQMDIYRLGGIFAADNASTILWVGAIAGFISGVGGLVVALLRWQSDKQKQEGDQDSTIFQQYERLAPGLGNVVKFYEDSEARMRELATSLRAELAQEREERAVELAAEREERSKMEDLLTARCEGAERQLESALRTIEEQQSRIAELERKLAT